MRILDIRDQVLRRKTVGACEGVVATPRSGRGNMGAQGHNAGHLSFPI